MQPHAQLTLAYAINFLHLLHVFNLANKTHIHPPHITNSYRSHPTKKPPQKTYKTLPCANTGSFLRTLLFQHLKEGPVVGSF